MSTQKTLPFTPLQITALVLMELVGLFLIITGALAGDVIFLSGGALILTFNVLQFMSWLKKSRAASANPVAPAPTE